VLWDASAKFDVSYKDVIIDIYCPLKLDINSMVEQEGHESFAKCLKRLAQTYSSEKGTRNHYCERIEDYGKDVYKAAEMSKATGCRIGYLYTNNSSKHTLSETLKLNLKGAEILWPPAHDNTYELELPAGKDHIAIFRATEDSTSYGYVPSVKPRVKHRNELIQLAKQ